MKIVFAHNFYKRHKQMLKTINNRQFIDVDKMVIVSNGNYWSFINYFKILIIQKSNNMIQKIRTIFEKGYHE